MDGGKVHPDKDPKNLKRTSTLKDLGVISVRDKVIEELRSVQERVNHDPRADVALEYSIKMIVSNQLN